MASAESKKEEETVGAEVEERTASGIRYSVATTPHFGMWFDIDDILLSTKSAFQSLKVAKSREFGRVLFLDGQLQSAESDEHLYHEALIHPALLQHRKPKRVFLGGAGDLAAAREVLKHDSVDYVKLVDIDKAVIDATLLHLPSFADGCSKDPRLEIVVGDAVKALREETGTFDVIVMDIADPIEAGPGIVCYFESFYKMLLTRLSADGVFVTQSGPGGNVGHTECSTVIHNTLKQVFASVHLYTNEVPSFEQPWAFNLAFKRKTDRRWLDDIQAIDDELNKRFGDRVDALFKCYDGQSHAKMFSLPKAIRDSIASETRVMTEDTPVYMYA